MWFAIIIVCLAASGNNIGKVLQKQATRTLPKLTLRKEIVTQYLRSGLWLTGMLTDLGGALLMIVAFAYAPVGAPIQDFGGDCQHVHVGHLAAQPHGGAWRCC